jgi:hypothetical protein
MTIQEREQQIAIAFAKDMVMFNKPIEQLEAMFRGFTCTPTYKSIPEADGWIPVSERLPEPNEIMLTLHKQGQMLCEDFHNGLWTSQINWFDSTNPVTHWMHLPAPPKTT